MSKYKRYHEYDKIFKSTTPNDDVVIGEFSIASKYRKRIPNDCENAVLFS